MRRFVYWIAWILVLLFLVGTPVLAWTYVADINVIEKNGTNYGMLAPTVPVNTPFLVANNYITGTGLDTRVKTDGGTLPHMLAADRLLFALPVGAFATNPLKFYAGESALLEFYIIAGYNGYITTVDDPALELVNSFAVETRGYFDTSAGAGKYIVLKPGAFDTYVSAAGTVTSRILGTATTTTQNAQSWSLNVGASVVAQRGGQRFNAFPSSYITSADLYLRIVLAPAGTGYLRIRSVAGDTVLGTLGTVDVGTLGAGYAWITFNATPVSIVPPQDIRLSFEYNGGDAANYVQLGANAPSVVADVFTYYQTGVGWTDDAGSDLTWQNLTYITPTAVTVTGAVPIGLHTIKTTADTVNLNLYVDDMGVPVATTALGGAVPNTAAPYWWGLNNAVPYFEYIKMTTNIAPPGEKIWYQPLSYIVGTALPNRDSGGLYPGVFTWGTNPVGISVTIGGMVAYDAGAAPAGQVQNPSVLGTFNPPANQFPQTPELTGQGHFLYPIMRDFSTLLTTPIQMLWYWCAALFVLMAMVNTHKFLQNLFLTGIAGIGAIAACVGMSFLPFWFIILAVISMFAIITLERSPSV